MLTRDMEQNPQREKHGNAIHHISERTTFRIVSDINVLVRIINHLQDLIQKLVCLIPKDAVVKILSHCLSLYSG